jgi:hypothetical protein
VETLSIDVDVDPIYYINKKEYTDGFIFYYAGIEDIVADKVDAVSKPKVINRIKDVYDLYLIALHCEVSFEKVKHSQEKIYRPQREVEREEAGLRFYDFLNSIDELRDTYENRFETLRYKKQKPQFKEVYSIAKEFIKPFLDSDYLRGKAVWDTKEQEWVVSPDDFLKPSFIFQGK